MKKRTIKECFKYFVKPITKDKVEGFFKKIAITSIILFLTFTLAKSLEKEIPSIFLLDKGVVDSQITFYGYWFVLIIAILFCLYFFLFRRFKFQFWQYLIFSAVVFFYYVLSNSPLDISWKFIDINESINAVDPFYYILILFFILNVLRATIVSSYRVYKDIKDWNNEGTESIEEVGSKGLVKILNFVIDFNEWRKRSDTIFLEDNPLDSEEDTASYTSLLEQIKPILYTDKYEKSFSVAIVGAWGSGKSSFIKALTKNIDDYNDEYLLKVKKQVLHFNFSPFLNHDENSIIKEFFTKLSHVLGKRSGKLSNQLIAYSKKLTNLAKEGDLLSFLTPVQSELFNQSAHELYESISDTIKSLNVKIIITIDDLDRLSGNEILEVLKLIRNTSNFPNTVFFVALDKKYVLNTIEKKEAIKYLDKFFQLEISIAKTSYSRVLSYLESNLKQMTFSYVGTQLIEKFDVINGMSTLSFHISSYRESKRFCNQFLLDFLLVNQINKFNQIQTLELTVKDLINLTLLKLYYPEVMDSLAKDELGVFGDETGYNAIVGGNVGDEKLNVENKVKGYFGVGNNVSRYKGEQMTLRLSYLLIDLFGVTYDSTILNPLRGEVPFDSVINKEILDRYFEGTNYIGGISILDFKEIIGDAKGYKRRIKSISLNSQIFNSFINKLNSYNGEDVLMKAYCFYEVVLLKEAIRFGVIDSFVDSIYSLYLNKESSFDEFFSKVLKDENFTFEKKVIYIFTLMTKFEDTKFLEGDKSSQINEEVKKNAHSLMDVMIHDLETNLKRFEGSYIDIGSSYGYRKLMFNVFKEKFKNLDLLEFCKTQLKVAKVNSCSYVVMEPFVFEVIKSPFELEKLLISHPSYESKKDQLIEFVIFYKLYYRFLGRGTEFKGLTYRFNYFPFSYRQYFDEVGEVIFEVLDNTIFNLLKNDTKSIRHYFKKEFYSATVDTPTNLIIITIDSRFREKLREVKKEIITKIPMVYNAREINSDKKWVVNIKTGEPLINIVSVQKFEEVDISLDNIL